MRTPEARFASLPGFPFAPRYLEWRGRRAHYVDQGKGGHFLQEWGEDIAREVLQRWK